LSRRGPPAHRAAAHDDDVAVLGIGQVDDALVGLALLAHGLDERPLLLGKPLRLVQRLFAGLCKRGPHVALDAGKIKIAGEGGDHRRYGDPALLFNSKPERLKKRVPA
jgi:hypothetical protein